VLRASTKPCTAQDTTQVMHAECVRMNPDIQSTWPQHKVQTHSISRYEHSGRPPTDGLHAVPYRRPRVAAAAAQATTVSAAAVSRAKLLWSPRSARAQHRTLTQIPAPRSAAHGHASPRPTCSSPAAHITRCSAARPATRHMAHASAIPRQRRATTAATIAAAAVCKGAKHTAQRVRRAWPTSRPPAAVTASRAACWRPRRRRRRGRGPVPS
jgi:hypothetical protein